MLFFFSISKIFYNTAVCKRHYKERQIGKPEIDSSHLHVPLNKYLATVSAPKGGIYQATQETV